MNNKNKIAILSLIALAIIGILSGASYAYFSVGNKQGNNTVIESGTMALTFTDGPQINATNLIPGEYIEKTFSVRNTGTVSTTYDVYLSEVINTFVQKSDLVYEITSTDGGYNTPSEVVVPNEECKIINQQSIGVGVTHHYTLKITYKLTNQIQNDNMGRGFTAKININEYTTNNSEHLLKLLDTSNNIVDKQIISSGITDYYYNLANTSLTGTTNIYCNNGGIPTIENNTLKVSDITNDTECKISNDVVDTFTNKLSTAKTGIVMTNNQDNTTRLSVPASKEVVFDLNGKTINSAGLDLPSGTWNENYVGLRVFGVATINDSVGTGTINTGVNEPALATNSGGTLYINGGNYNGKHGFHCGGSNSYTEINGGNFDSTVNANFSIGGNNNKIVINDINVTHAVYGSAVFNLNADSASSIDFNNGNININENAWIFTTGTGNKGTININNGNFSNTATGIIGLRDGALNISDGTFNAPNTYLISTVEGKTGILNIYNGTFTSKNRTITNNSETSTVNIYNGHFECANDTTINNFGGILNINNGYFKSTGGHIVRTDGSNAITTINGGYITSGGNAISSVRCYSGKLNINNGYIESTRSNTIFINSSCTSIINGDDAIFDNKGDYVSGLYINRNNKDRPDSNMPTIANEGDLTIYYATVNNDSIHSSLHNNMGEMKVYDGKYESVADYVISFCGGNSYIYGGTYNGAININTYNDGTTLYSGSHNYICGGTFNSSGHNITVRDSTALLKYKSNVAWTGKTSPTVDGSYPNTVSLDDTITCE